MSDERLFIHVCAGCGAQMTHARPCAPGCGSIEAESIEVVEAAALARVKRERNEAREEAATISDALGAMTDERDALRAQVEALTGVLAVAISAEAERQWAANEVPVEEYVGWKDAAEWLAAASDAAAAKAPERAAEEGDCERDCIDQCQGPCGVAHLVEPDQPDS